MNLDNLKDSLIKQGAEYSLCDEYIGYIKAAKSLKDLVKLYFAGDDFCISNNYPSVESLIPYADEAKKYGLIVNDSYAANGVKRIVAVGSSIVNATFENYDIGIIIARDTSVINVFAYGFSKVFIYAGKDTIINEVVFTNAKIIVKYE